MARRWDRICAAFVEQIDIGLGIRSPDGPYPQSACEQSANKRFPFAARRVKDLPMSDWDDSRRLRGRRSAKPRPRAPAPYLDGLNPPSARRWRPLEGPVLVLAGAGTGKTRALTTRIAHLLQTGRARPNEILAVTFTNKAAREMKERVGGFVGGAVEGMPWLGTFHAICVKILRRHAELVGLKSQLHHPRHRRPAPPDQAADRRPRAISTTNAGRARLLAGIIDGWKNRAWTPDTCPRPRRAFATARAGRSTPSTRSA
jgi:DNA helicase-2/ATP-dependent DNA helicase PcrA